MADTYVRRARRAECIQWTGANTEDVLNFLEENRFRGELFRDYIQVYLGMNYNNTLRKTDWVIKQENGVIKFWNDDTMQSKYEREEGIKTIVKPREGAVRYDEFIEKQLRVVAAMRGDGNEKCSLAYQAAECIARLRTALGGDVVELGDVPDAELPGMWERADFM